MNNYNWSNSNNSQNFNWNAIGCDQTGQHVVAGTNSSGIYYSNDYGKTWNKSNAPTNTIYVKIIFPINSNFCYASGAIGLLISYDNGITWKDTGFNRTGLNPNSKGFYIACDTTGIKIAGVVGSGGQICTSEDGGKTWIKRTNDSQNWQCICCNSDRTILAASFQYGQIYTSKDSGVTWTKRTNDSQNWYSMICNTTGKIIVAVANSNGGIWMSGDYGDTWHQRAVPISNWVSIAGDSLCSKLIAVANNQYIYTSNDYGTSWNQEIVPGSLYWNVCCSNLNGNYVWGGAGYKQIWSGIYIVNNSISNAVNNYVPSPAPFVVNNYVPSPAPYEVDNYISTPYAVNNYVPSPAPFAVNNYVPVPVPSPYAVYTPISVPSPYAVYTPISVPVQNHIFKLTSNTICDSTESNRICLSIIPINYNYKNVGYYDGNLNIIINNYYGTIKSSYDAYQIAINYGVTVYGITSDNKLYIGFNYDRKTLSSNYNINSAKIYATTITKLAKPSVYEYTIFGVVSGDNYTNAVKSIFNNFSSDQKVGTVKSDKDARNLGNQYGATAFYVDKNGNVYITYNFNIETVLQYSGTSTQKSTTDFKNQLYYVRFRTKDIQLNNDLFCSYD